MKKIFTLFSLLAVFAPSFSQQIDLQQYEVPKYPAKRQLETPEVAHQITTNNFRGAGEVVWLDDFSDPTTWDINNTNGDYGWQITTSENGWFFAGTINSSSQGEYAFIWNGSPDAPLFAEYYMTSAEPIDISGMTAGVLEYELYGARFTDSLIVEISTDGMNFTKIADHDDLSQLTIFSGSVSANPTIRRFNITPTVAANDQLWIRFRWNGEIGYGYFIDDVKLIDPVDYDLEIMEVWTGDILFDYEYTKIPVAQLTPQIIGASYRNMGAKTATGVALHATHTPDGGDTEFDGTSNPVDLEPGGYDTIWFDTGFIPSALNDTEYNVSFEMVMDSTDACPDNNMMDQHFMVTESIWGNDRYDTMNLSFDGEFGSVTQEDEFKIGCAFQVAQPNTTYELIHFNVAPGTTIGQIVSFELFVVDLSTFEFTSLSYMEYMIGSADLSGTSSLATDDPITLDVGETYVLAIGHIGSDHLIVRGNEGDNDFSTFLYGPYGSTNDPSWFTFNVYSPAIRLGLDASISVPELSSEQLEGLMNQNYPNPFSNSTTISYELLNAGQVTLELRNSLGQLVEALNPGAQSIGKHNIQLDRNSLSPGLYEYTLITPDGRFTKKLNITK